MHTLAEIKEHKMAIMELKQDQDYWEAKWELINRKSKVEYVNYHTADRLRDTAIAVDMEIDDLIAR